jgi:hypothetical protein
MVAHITQFICLDMPVPEGAASLKEKQKKKIV